MKKGITMTVAAGAGMAMTGAAYGGLSYTIDLSGFVLGPTQYSEIHMISAPGGVVTGIEWNYSYEAGASVGTASWASEVSIELVSPDGVANNVVPSTAAPGGFFPATPGNAGTFIWGSTDAWSPGFSPGADANSHNLGWPSSSGGIYNSSGSTGALDGWVVDGNWTLNLFDSYDDGAQGTFHTFQLTIHYIPAPGALALLGLAGLVGCRRRRE